MVEKTAGLGKLIVFEGIDGTGKTTQIELLADRLVALGHRVVKTREPTDGVFGRRIRELLSHRHELTPDLELKLFMDDRREHVEDLLRPALERGDIVLTDRYYFSTAAYQGAAGHDPDQIIVENEAFAPLPDLLILLTMDPAVSVKRIREQRGEIPNDFEQEDYLRRVAGVFAGLKRDFLVRVPAEGGIEDIHQLIMEQVAEVITL